MEEDDMSVPGVPIPCRRHDPPELWFRGSVVDAIRAQHVTATIRLGERTAKHAKGYVIDDCVLIRCFDETDTPQFQCWVVVQDVHVLTLQAIGERDLLGCPDGERAPALLRALLHKHYGRPIAEDEPLTIIRFAYASDGASYAT